MVSDGGHFSVREVTMTRYWLQNFSARILPSPSVPPVISIVFILGSVARIIVVRNLSFWTEIRPFQVAFLVVSFDANVQMAYV